jgi:nucleotide-binding universal stress UspA family protein
MPADSLLCTHDLTPVSDAALAYALPLADRLGVHVTVLHVIKPGIPQHEVDAIRSTLQARIDELGGRENVRLLVHEGSFLKRIADESSNGHSLAVIGTHGPRGLKQKLFGADILKLVRDLAVPALVVQEGCLKHHDLGRIVLPVAGHSNIAPLLDAVCMLARVHGSEVIIYQLVRPGEQPSENLLANKVMMLDRLDAEGIVHREENEPSTLFSAGFAAPTIAHAARTGAGCIAIMAHASMDHRHIADAEKERMLTNDACIPILCV